MSAKLLVDSVETPQTRLMMLAAFSVLAILAPAGTAAGQQATEPSAERLIDSRKLNEVQAMIEREIAANGQTPDRLYGKAKILFQERKFQDSIDTLTALFGAPPASFDGSNLEAWRHFLDGRPPEALTLMGMNHVLLGNPVRAEPFLVVAAEKQPSESSAQFRLALLYYTTNRFSQAADAARAVSGLAPSFGKAYEVLGLSLEELRRGPEAITAYRKAIELDRSSGSGDPSPYISLGKALLNQAEYSESGVMLRRALQLNPNSEEASFLLGKVLYKLESYAESERYLRGSIALAAEYAEPRYLLSLLLSRQGRSEEAREQMQVFLELHRSRPQKTSLLSGSLE